MRWPCVSVIVNTYDRPLMLSRALLSVLKQDFEDFEVLVVHDGPADGNTVEACSRAHRLFSGRDVPFTFFGLEENSGYQCVPKNTATTHARGDYIAYLDDDNEWTPNHLSVLVEAIEEGSVWPDFVYGRREYVDTREVKEPVLTVGPSPFVPWTEEARQRLASSPMNNFIDTSDMLIGKGPLWRLHLATGQMWNEGWRRFGDWELITRGVFFSGWRGRGVDEIVQKYYWHGANIQLTRPVKEIPEQKHVKDLRVHSNQVGLGG